MGDAIKLWALARRYPEVLAAHAQFGGDLEKMLLGYHAAEEAAAARTVSAQKQPTPNDTNENESGAKGG